MVEFNLDDLPFWVINSSSSVKQMKWANIDKKGIRIAESHLEVATEKYIDNREVTEVVHFLARDSAN